VSKARPEQSNTTLPKDTDSRVVEKSNKTWREAALVSAIIIMAALK